MSKCRYCPLPPRVRKSECPDCIAMENSKRAIGQAIDNFMNDIRKAKRGNQRKEALPKE